MPVTINSSVGQGGNNAIEDVRSVQQLINRIPRHLGGSPRPALREDGLYGPNLMVAIKRFQWRLFPQRHRPVDGLVEPGGSTLREMNRMVEGQTPIRPRPGGTRGRAIPLYITEMWNLIVQMHTRNLDVYPKELLVGLFWEETSFLNIRGRARSDMIGFGQVHSGNFSAINQRYNRSYTPATVLGDNAQSVEIASFTLDNALTDGQSAGRPRRQQRAALGYYATGRAGGWNPVINGWLRCMQLLQTANLNQLMAGQISDANGIAIREALWSARPGAHSVWSPDMALPPEL